MEIERERRGSIFDSRIYSIERQHPTHLHTFSSLELIKARRPPRRRRLRVGHLRILILD